MAAAFVLGACSSTAQLSQDGTSFGDAASVDVAATGEDVAAGGLADEAVDAAGPQAAGASLSGSRSAALRASTAATSAVKGPVSGRGFTKDTIYIGYLTWKDVSAAGGAVGYAVDYGDQEAIGQAVADDINARGGIAGRKVVLNFYDYNTGDVLSNTTGGDQAACAKMTEDRPVFAVVAVTGILSEVLPDCLMKRQTPLIANTNVPYVAEAFRRWAPYFWSTASPMTERLIPVWLRRAAATGYFTGWDTTLGAPGPAPVKVGILTNEGQPGDIFTALVEAELKRQGIPVGATARIASPFDSTGINSAILAFRNNGVTHVVPDSLNLLLFPQAAESQRYRPRYTLTTASAPLLVASAAPAAQLAGTLGVGYYASYDVPTANDPGDPSPAAGRCRAAQARKGGDTNQRESWNLMTKACDGFFFLNDAITRGGLSVGGFANGAFSLQSVQPSGAFAIGFANNRFDGLSAVRDLGFVSDCRCFRFLNNTNRPL